MLDPSSQHSPSPNPTQTHPSLSNGTSDQTTPGRRAAYPAKAASSSEAETAVVSIMGQNGWLDDEAKVEGRAKRELSVIEEQLSNSVTYKEGDVATPELEGETRDVPDLEEDQSTVDGADSPLSQEVQLQARKVSSMAGSLRSSTFDEDEGQHVPVAA